MSSSYNQTQAQGTAYPAYTAPPPPAGYPVRDDPAAYPTTDPAPAPGKTKSRGDGFWKGCCAALCCCWVLDVCC